MHLYELVFPLYKLRSLDYIKENNLGIIQVATPKRVWDLDDPNLKGSFAERRLQMVAQGRKIYPLKKKIDYLAQVISEPSGTTFVDSEGKVFTYKKTGKFWSLDYFKITKLEHVGTNTIVYAHKVSCPFFFASLLNIDLKYIGLLNKDGQYIPYELTFEKKESTRRMI